MAQVERQQSVLDILQNLFFATLSTEMNKPGHVFENLFAACNPETGMIARKATGSFYTPRVVVEWMVDQALMVYLNAALEDSGASRRPRVAGSQISAPVTQGHREPASQRPRVAGGENGGAQQPDALPHADRLGRLLSWEDNGHDFSKEETETLIDATR